MKRSLVKGTFASLIPILFLTLFLTAAAAQVQAAATGSPITGAQWTPPDPAYKIEVEHDGVYQLTYNGLQAAGVPVDALDPRTLRMFWMGEEMAIEVVGEEDGVFNSDDILLFYGRGIDSLYYAGILPDHKYTGANVYWLTYGSGNGLRVGQKDGAIDGASAGAYLKTDRYERQTFYITSIPRYRSTPTFRPQDDHWFVLKVQSFGTGSWTPTPITFNISGLATGSYSARVTARVVGNWAVKHGLRLWVNGNQVYENTSDWVDFEAFSGTATFPQAYLQNGANTIGVEIFNIDAAGSESYIDWVELTYYREHVAANDILTFDGEADGGVWKYKVSNFASDDVQIYDVTQLHRVQQVIDAQIEGDGPYSIRFGDGEAARRYVALTPAARRQPQSIREVTRPTSVYTPIDLLNTANAADWIVITHVDFWEATLPLAEYRNQRAPRYRVAMVDVQQIYDQFNGGLLSSESIRDFLAYTHQHWRKPAPQFVLLAGGGSNDMRGYKSDSKQTYVPTFLYPADPTLGETAADNRFVTLAGDVLPDMHLGRFPAFAPEEITIMVDKTIRYESTPPLNDWNTNVLFISDNLKGGGGDFYRFSDEIADGYADPEETIKFLPAPYVPIKAYLGRTCDLDNPSTAVECRRVIRDAINDGVLFTSYVGHAVKHAWASERLMDTALVAELTNNDRLSIFLPMSCFEGFYHDMPKGSRTLAETYMIHPPGAAVASWSPTGFGVATGHDLMQKGLFLAVFHDHVRQLGAAMTQAKIYMYNTAPPDLYNDLIDTFVQFGDPALQIQTWVTPTSVDMAGFSVQAQDDGVLVKWTTANEVQIWGFDLLRSESERGPFLSLNAEPLLAQTPGSAQGHSYQFVDSSAIPDLTYWYRLEVLKLNGTREPYGLANTNAVANHSTLYLPQLQR